MIPRKTVCKLINLQSLKNQGCIQAFSDSLCRACNRETQSFTNRSGSGLIGTVAHLWKTSHFLVQVQEARMYALYHILSFELLRLHYTIEQMFRAVRRHESTRVTVEHGEVAPIGQAALEACDRLMRVLHLQPPALHAGHSVLETIALATLIVFIGLRRVQKCPHY